MSAPWLQIIGIGEDGEEGLSAPALTALAEAQVIFGAARHHRIAHTNTKAERHTWPSPFNALIDEVKAHRGKRVVVLATGDPLWYSVGTLIGQKIAPDEVVYHPQVSAFQWVAARLGWPMAEVETLTAHGRPLAQIFAFVAPSTRLIVLSAGAETPTELARWLTDNGYGRSRMYVLAAVGGVDEIRYDGLAQSWSHDVPAFNTIAVECVAGADARVLPRIGIPDDAFHHDGKITKREVRTITVARLSPRRGELLWDVGAGCGSISVEWVRATHEARAQALEPNADRRAYIAANAQALGAPQIDIVDGKAPEALADLRQPDAVFIGGGLSVPTFETCYRALPPHGRLVANAVTLESEAILLHLYSVYGGELTRLSVAHASGLGPLTGWRPLMPITQWAIQKSQARQ